MSAFTLPVRAQRDALALCPHLALAARYGVPAVALVDRLPLRPFASHHLPDGCRRTSPAAALNEPYLQVNPSLYTSWLVFDIDHPGSAFAHEFAPVPPPNLVVSNPTNGHAHLFYGLAQPVLTSWSARPKPIYLLAVIQQHFSRLLRADPGYAGLLAKNPLSSKWDCYSPRAELYTLDELAEYVTHDDRLASRHRTLDTVGLGRNVILFNDLRTWAYSLVLQYKAAGARPEEFRRALEGQAEARNAQFPEPLPASEVRAATKSVAKWVWRHFTPAAFAEIQRRRGRKGGIASGAVRRKDSDAARQPWLAEGISRRTWYRRKWQKLEQCSRDVHQSKSSKKSNETTSTNQR